MDQLRILKKNSLKRYFFKKYIERIARFVKGYSVDSTGQVVLKSELPLDSKNLSF